MNLQDLQIKIAEVLGVSSTQKELAYDTFMEKVYESLHEGLTLKVPRLGFFQFKPNESKNSSGRSIIYSSLSEDFDRDSRNLYLTLHVSPKSKTSIDFDSNVFSIGVGKPLLPLTFENMPNSETSYAMLRKSIEERAKELISESDHIPNFDLFEDYYNLSDEQKDDTEDVRFTLSNLTSDLDTVHNEEEPISSPSQMDDIQLNSLMENSNEPEESKKEATKLELHGVDESPELNEIEAEKENTEIKEIPPSDIDAEKLPDIILADLLGDQISTGENKVEKQEVAKEEEQDSISIHEFLNQEEVHDTVNIETFLKEERTEQVGEGKSSPIEEVETNPKEEGTEGIEEEKIVPIEEEKTAHVSEETAPTEAAEELQQESIPLSPVHDDENIDVPSSIEKELKQDVDTNTPAQSENKPEDFNELNIEEPKTDDINIPITTQMFGEDVENERIKDEQEPEESVIKKIDEPKHEVENHLDVNKLLEESDFGEQKDDELWREEDGEHEEKIEWNWGDELKEEFGLGHLEGEDAKFEMVDDKNWEKEDEPVSDKKLYKDLFAQLEKTIENEKTIFEEDVKSNKWKVEKEEPADIKFPSQDDKPSEKFSLKDDEKVYLEFSNPPSKYEFVADKKPRKDKHRSVMLEEEAPSPDEKRHVYSREMNHTTSVRPEKDNYFGKIFLLIFSAFVIISASIYFLLRNNSQKQTATETSISQKTSNENAIVDSIIQAQTKTTSNDSSRIGLDEFSDFPTTATPPVPIKTGTTAQIANQNPNQSIKKLEEKPIQPKTENVNVSNTNTKSQASRSEGDGLYRTLATDNRIDKTIYFDGSKYNFQTSSWRNKAKAEQEAKRLKRLGLDSFITEAYLPQKGGTWYRVRIGSFNSQKEAQEFMTKNNY